MLWNFAMVYLGGWLVATVVVFAVGTRISETGLPVRYRFLLSAAAGAIWPLLLIGAAQYTSMAVYSSAETYAATKRPDFPLLEMDTEQTRGDVVALR